MRYVTAEEVIAGLDRDESYIREVLGGHVHYCACSLWTRDGADGCRDHRWILEAYFNWCGI